MFLLLLLLNKPPLNLSGTKWKLLYNAQKFRQESVNSGASAQKTQIAGAAPNAGGGIPWRALYVTPDW